MSVGRILTQGFGSFGGRKYLPTMGLGSFAQIITRISTKRTVCVGTSLMRSDCVGTSTARTTMVGTSMEQREMIGTDP